MYADIILQTYDAYLAEQSHIVEEQKSDGGKDSIGLAILQSLARSFPQDHFLLACRTVASGEEAVQQLRELDVKAAINIVELDVTSDESIAKAREWVEKKFGGLDVLINNAGMAVLPNPSNSNLRASWTTTLSTKLTSVACLTSAFLPLLKRKSHAMVINVSSARASLTLSTAGNLPPTRVVAYSVSKTALNALTIEMAKSEPAVRVYSVSPGHCRTAFNGFSGKKDPLDGAKVVVELVAGNGQEENGFWEFEEGRLRIVPW
ncbi:hypothetical protein MMC18_000345 [Xylographa bjoerkii]|nr:hypothetical protein [Xylographa bjoerkii]